MARNVHRVDAEGRGGLQGQPQEVSKPNGSEYYALLTSRPQSRITRGISGMKTAPVRVAISLMALQLAASMVYAAEEMPAEIIAVQIRDQGYACGKSVSAKRDEKLSRPDEAAWILKCDNATYRVRLIPDMAAKVERLD